MTINTLNDIIYIHMKNDVSLLVHGRQLLVEQQSTPNPNQPIRDLMYYALLMEKYVDTLELNLYGSKLVSIPMPKCITLYNGRDAQAPVQKLKLSDTYMVREPDIENEYEWTVTVYNINRGANAELLKKCPPLAEYMAFVNLINDNRDSGMTVYDAIDTAVKDSIDHHVLEDILKEHRGEVCSMCMTEFNEEVFIKNVRDEGIEQGIEKGSVSSFVQSIKGIIENFHVSLDDAIKIAGVPAEYIQAVKAQLDCGQNTAT